MGLSIDSNGVESSDLGVQPTIKPSKSQHKTLKSWQFVAKYCDAAQRVTKYCEVYVHRLRRPYTSYPQAICIGARRPLRRICASGRSICASGLAGNILWVLCLFPHTLDIYIGCVYNMCVGWAGLMHRPGLAWPHSSAIFWFSTGVLWKSGKPSGCHNVKRSDYITNSVRCQGTVIFLNKMKGESERPVTVEKLAQSLFFYVKNGLI